MYRCMLLCRIKGTLEAACDEVINRICLCQLVYVTWLCMHGHGRTIDRRMKLVLNVLRWDRVLGHGPEFECIFKIGLPASVWPAPAFV